ncbi:type I-C CRISPR-associated protein Cas8c/Csd1 [Kutzneria viridogrisea]|uniref:CRISPR-associated protein Csd1 n=1 Tax=Kutzneria viridogrisea TaxID=47990 RepID=A0ABR6BRA4_9PSEU|nr:CRISPR-associated protein Csd1 [Kutzneria viridogrisea]
MLLQRLAAYAAADPATAPFHRSRLFSWHLDLDRDGRPRSPDLLPLTRTDAKGRVSGVPHTVPIAVRTSGVAANLAADDVQYVLGWHDPDGKPERAAQCLQAFSALSQQWADSEHGRDDPVARAVARFYRDGHHTAITRAETATAKQGVLITVEGQPAYQAPSAAPFWAGEVARRKGDGVSGLCLVCATSGPLLDTVPGKVPARLVPGASNDAALVSINERVFGYDLSTQLACTPVCLTCGEAVTAGLTGVLSSPHATSYGGQDSRMAWWVTDAVEFDVMTLLDRPDPEAVNRLLHAVHEGRLPPEFDTARFCSLTVGGNIARVMVRDWLETPLAHVADAVAAWLADSEITPTWPTGRTHHGLGQMTLATGRWQRQAKRYADFGAKGADRPTGAHRDLLKAALRHAVLPPSLLVHLLNRIRTDGHLDDARAALLRLALLRSPTVTENPMPGLDPTNTTPAYVAGRAFAALEALQYDVTAGKVNTTYADRYFAGAITNPRAALVNGRKDANAWLRKLRRTRGGAAVNHEKTLDELFGLLTAQGGIPARVTIAQQALFLLGYHHQRAHRFATLTRSQETPA